MTKALAEFSKFVELLNPYRETSLTSTDNRVTWVFASEMCKLEVSFDTHGGAYVTWQLQSERKYHLAPSGNVSVVLTDPTKVQELVALVKPLHDAIAQARADDTVRQVFNK